MNLFEFMMELRGEIRGERGGDRLKIMLGLKFSSFYSPF